MRLRLDGPSPFAADATHNGGRNCTASQSTQQLNSLVQMVRSRLRESQGAIRSTWPIPSRGAREMKKKSPLRVTRAGERRPSTAREYRHSRPRSVGGRGRSAVAPDIRGGQKKRTTGAAPHLCARTNERANAAVVGTHFAHARISYARSEEAEAEAETRTNVLSWHARQVTSSYSSSSPSAYQTSSTNKTEMWFAVKYCIGPSRPHTSMQSACDLNAGKRQCQVPKWNMEEFQKVNTMLNFPLRL